MPVAPRVKAAVILLLSIAVGFGARSARAAEKPAEAPAQAPAQAPAEAPAQDRPAIQAKFQFTQYFDTRRFETTNILTQVDNLPLGFKIWGFTDFHGNQGSPDGRIPLDRYFMEYRLLRPLASGLLADSDAVGAIVEYDDLNGGNNSLVRAGVYYQHAAPLPGRRKASIQWRMFPWESDGRGSQASLSYRIPLTGRMDVTGFADMNFMGDGRRVWLFEPQLNLRLNQHLAAVAEFRYNGFEEIAQNLQGSGLALGLRITP